MKKDFLVSKTPLRISLFGGGTDFPYYFNKYESNVVNFTINKFSYVTLKYHNNLLFNEKFRLNYSESENVKSIDQIKNKIIKNSLIKKKIDIPIYISTINDIPSGTGLGSSGSFCVGLLNCINNLNKNLEKKMSLASEATDIELKLGKENVGYQDQFAAAYGGFNHFIFNKKKTRVKNLIKYKKHLKLIIDRSALVWTGKSRKSSLILNDLKKKLDTNLYTLKKMNNICLNFLDLLDNFSYNIFIDLIKENSELKNSLSEKINNKKFEKMIKNNRKVIASKILGAGGDGFILCFFKDKKDKNIFLKENKNSLDYIFCDHGSIII